MRKSTSFLWLLRYIFFQIKASNSHYLWAEIDSVDNGSNNVNIVFSEEAGVPDPVIKILAKRVTDSGMAFISGEGGKSITLENEGDHLVGKIESNKDESGKKRKTADDPFLVSGFLDYGPFPIMQPPPDLQYTFVAQKFSEESDWENFFEQLHAPYFAVLMVSGTMCGPPYKVAIAGADFDPSQTAIDVCLFEKGGKKIGCTHSEPDEHSNIVEEDDDDNKYQRHLFLTIEKEENDRNLRKNIMLDESPPKYVYALANATIGENDSMVLKFASTSIELNGECNHGGLADVA